MEALTWEARGIKPLLFWIVDAHTVCRLAKKTGVGVLIQLRATTLSFVMKTRENVPGRERM